MYRNNKSAAAIQLDPGGGSEVGESPRQKLDANVAHQAASSAAGGFQWIRFQFSFSSLSTTGTRLPIGGGNKLLGFNHLWRVGGWVK